MYNCDMYFSFSTLSTMSVYEAPGTNRSSQITNDVNSEQLYALKRYMKKYLTSLYYTSHVTNNIP